MTTPEPEIDAAALKARMDALPGLAAVREAAGETPVHLVGGVVRDLLLGRERADVDMVVEGGAVELARRLGGKLTVHERFGTATVHLDGHSVDLATARAESYPHPGALPEVRAGTLSDDLARRDFTINAMALPLTGDPELVDPYGGRADLKAGTIRVLHPASFADDPTRALRAARYAGRLGFTLEAETAELLARADLEAVSSERVEAELRKLAADEDPAAGLELAAGWGLIELAAEAPELIRATSELLQAEPWSGLTSRPDAVLAVVTGRLGPARELAAQRPERPSQAVEAAHGHTGATLVLARALGGEWLDRYVAEWRHVRLEIAGADLLEAGVPEGPAVGRGLEAALRAKLDGEIAGPEQELQAALTGARAGDGG